MDEPEEKGALPGVLLRYGKPVQFLKGAEAREISCAVSNIRQTDGERDRQWGREPFFCRDPKSRLCMDDLD